MLLKSNITFLYFHDLPEARAFFETVLGLEAVYDPGWSVVYRLGRDSFLGAVDAASGSLQVTARGGVLISLAVANIEEVHSKLSQLGLELSPLKMVKDIPLKSFFFTGPEGYEFEIQQFTAPELTEIFG